MAQAPKMAIIKEAKLPTNSQEVEEKKVPALDEDNIFNILVRFPAQSVYNLRYICKPWLKLTCNPIFIDTHLLLSEPGVLIAQPSIENENRYDTSFIKIEEGNPVVQGFDLSCKSRIMASCNGILLLMNVQNNQLLYVANPITKQSETLALAPFREDEFIGCGFTFIPSTKEYKVVRVFMDVWKYRIGYEILTLGSNTWKWVEQLGVGDLCWFFSYSLLSIKGVLYWQTFFSGEDGLKYMFSLDMVEEKCWKTRLPFGTVHQDRNTEFVEIDGFLAMLVQRKFLPTHISMWILKDFYGGEWVIHHCIALEFLRGMAYDTVLPIACLNNGKIIIFMRYESDHKYHCFYYDFGLRQARLWDMQLAEGHDCIVHVNSLKWWK